MSTQLRGISLANGCSGLTPTQHQIPWVRLQSDSHLSHAIDNVFTEEGIYPRFSSPSCAIACTFTEYCCNSKYAQHPLPLLEVLPSAVTTVLALRPKGPTTTRVHTPTKQPRQPFLSQSAMRGSHVLSCNGLRLTSQLKWRNAGQPARVIRYIDCTMLSQFFAYIQ